MKCFNHSDRDSVGTCMACGRGLCKECAVVTNNVITCHGQCEERGIAAGLGIRRVSTIRKLQKVQLVVLFFVIVSIGVFTCVLMFYGS